jgi:hypothetical protein
MRMTLGWLASANRRSDKHPVDAAQSTLTANANDTACKALLNISPQNAGSTLYLRMRESGRVKDATPLRIAVGTGACYSALGATNDGGLIGEHAADSSSDELNSD